MHPGLCHSDSRIASAARQARGVLVRFRGVRANNLAEAALEVMTHIDRPEELGKTDDERQEMLLAALKQMKRNRLLTLHKKRTRCRLTTAGMYANRDRGKSSRGRGGLIQA